MFYEVYRDRAWFEARGQKPHVRTFLSERGQYMARAPRVEFLDRIDGRGWPNGGP